MPQVVRRLNNALLRADQIDWSEGRNGTDWFAPIVADAEAGFGGALNAYELMRGMIEAGAAGVHFEDQLAAEKKCGHLGGKVLVPTSQFIRTLDGGAARRGRAERADGARRAHRRAQRDAADERRRRARRAVRHRRADERGLLPRPATGSRPRSPASLAYAPYADVLWFETSTPDLGEAKEFAAGDPRAAPAQAARVQLLAVVQLEAGALATRRSPASSSSSASWGYRFQFITLAGFHSLNAGMFELARGYRERGMSAYVELQEREFALEADGYTATKHQREVGAGYFDQVVQADLQGLLDARAPRLDGGSAIRVETPMTCSRWRRSASSSASTAS